MEDKELKKLAKDIFEKIEKKYQETAKEMIVADASVNASKEIKITDSKIEGIPYIPKGSKIPTNSEGKQFMFLAQINCADLKGLEDFPKEGILQFWVLGDDLMGLDFDNSTNRNGFDIIYYEKIEDYYLEDEFKKMYNPYKYDPAWDFLIAHHPCKMEFSLGKQKENLDYDFLDILFEKYGKKKILNLMKKINCLKKWKKFMDMNFMKKILVQNVMDFHFSHNLNQERVRK